MSVLEVTTLIVVVAVTFIGRSPGVEGAWSSSRNVDTYLYSPRVTSWGTWENWAYCYDGDYADGVDFQIEAKQGDRDDTGLNAIRLRCSSLNGKSSYWMQSKEGEWGERAGRASCNHFAVGFELRSERLQGSGGDNVAASDFQLYCDGPTQVGKTGGAEVLDWGDWSGVQRCPTGEAICGMQTQVENPLGGGGDDTALNNVDIACCKIEHPTSACTPTFNWRTVTFCAGNVCAASYIAGIAYNSDRSGNVAPDTSFYEYFGILLGDAYLPLNKSFRKQFPQKDVDHLISSDSARKRVIQTSFLDCNTGIEVLEMSCGIYTLTSPFEHRCKE